MARSSLEATMTDDNSHTQEGQNQRAQRLRQVIENLKEGVAPEDSPSEDKSLKEQIDERAREAAARQDTPGSK
jgi:hypothetical protein